MKFVGLMLVKNEEELIRDPLFQLLQICNKVYVIDDFSTDSTVEIVKKFGNTVVIQHALPEKFGEQRNWGLAQIQEDYDWLIMLDGDELFHPAVLQVFQWLNTSDVFRQWTGFHQPRYEAWMNGFDRVVFPENTFPDPQLRILRFRRDYDWTWEHKMHEPLRIASNGERLFKNYDACPSIAVPIFHRTYHQSDARLVLKAKEWQKRWTPEEMKPEHFYVARKREMMMKGKTIPTESILISKNVGQVRYL